MGSRWCLALTAAGLLGAGALAGVTAAAGQNQGPSGVGTPATGTTVSAAPALPAASSPYPQAPAADQTHPLVLPRRGRRGTRFAVYLELRQSPGHRGVLATDYRIGVVRPTGARSRCEPPLLPNITSGHAQEVIRVILTTPLRGWCAGRYTVTVFLQRGPYCPKPAPGEPPEPCPEFASQDLDAGHTHFLVQAN